jgi:cobalt-zinc-cadmium efflux system outer membrane protein
MLRLAGVCAIAWIVAPAPFAAAQTAPQAPATLTLSEAMARAGEANPALRAARTARAIDVAGLDVARQRPNPEVSVEVERETPHWAFAGTIPIEIGGKRQRRVDVANASIAATDAEVVNLVAQLRADVRRAYFLAVVAARRVSVAQDLEGIATRARDAARERFQTGAAPQLEALQAELALAQAQNDVAAAAGEANAANAELNALLAFPADAAPTLVDTLDKGPSTAPSIVTAQALAGNAELAMLDKRIETERARVALATAMRHPDPAFTGTLTYDAPGEFTFGWRAAAAVSLPVLTTGRPEVRVAEATLARAIAERDARAAEIGGTLRAALARATAARQAVDRFLQEILPASLRVEQMAEESYRSGQTGLPAYLQTLQFAREVRQRAIQAGLDYQLALADLERAMGMPLQ